RAIFVHNDVVHLNFSLYDMQKGIEYAHENSKKVYITVNSYPQQSELAACKKAIDDAYTLRADAVIVSDLAILDYTSKKYPDMHIHLSVQVGASNAEAIKFFKDNFNVTTVVLPRVVTIDEIKAISENCDVDIEIFAFGSLCINYEGKCFLSPYITGESTNTIGTCSTPKYLNFYEHADKLSVEMNNIIMNEYGADELALSPKISGGKYNKADSEETQWADNFLINRRQICKCRLINTTTGEKSYAMQSPVYLNTIDLLDKFIAAGVSSIKIEGRQRNEEYVSESVSIFRRVIDEYADTGSLSITDDERERLNMLFATIEPSQTCYINK
ncbi:peptidase U32 family protein, partial [Thermodesulfobacteriota bacterium]